MLSVKKELIARVNEVIDYPVTSVYPKERIVPICVIQETSNTSLPSLYDTSDVIYRFSLYSTDKASLNTNFNNLDNYMIGLGFERTLFEESDTEVVHGITVSYKGIIQLRDDTIKIYKHEY